jgi:hypothetical protein
VDTTTDCTTSSTLFCIVWGHVVLRLRHLGHPQGGRAYKLNREGDTTWRLDRRRWTWLIRLSAFRCLFDAAELSLASLLTADGCHNCTVLAYAVVAECGRVSKRGE